MKLINKIKENKALTAFLLCGLLGILIVLPTIILNKGIYSLTKDLNFQQIPFNKLINYSLKNGEFFWTWHNDLGSNFIGTFSFYNLFSPFNMIGYLFPESIFEYLIGPIYILKYAVSGLTSYLFLKRYVKDKNYAVLGSLLYTFSGFTLTNILFYHFHDVIAFFPLLLYTLDNFMYDNKKCWFACTLALCAFTNWFFFITECVFLVIYFIVKVFTKEYKLNIKKFLLLAFESIIGVGLASLVLIPSALFTVGNTRLSSNWSILSMLIYPIQEYAELIRAFIFPSEIMSIRGVFSEFNYKSVELYLPVVGLVLAFSYFLKNKKKWPSILSIVLLIFMFIPILNNSFFLFQTTYYARWFYMPILIFSLMSIKCLEESININKSLKIFTLGIIISSSIIIIINPFIHATHMINDTPYFILTIVFGLINILLLYHVTKSKNKLKLLTIFIFIYITIWGNINVYYYKEKNLFTSDSYYTYLKSNDILDLEPNVRTNSSSSCDYNYGYILKNNNIRDFNSNISSSAFEFYNTVGKKRKVKTKININNKPLNDFLGVKYIISCNNDDLSEYGYKLFEEKDMYKIYLNNEYKEFGFNVKDYITEDEFNELSKEERGKILNTKVVLTDEQIKKYKSLFNKDAKYLSNEFEFTRVGFKSKIESTDETLAIYQIPYDKGWIATNNGKNIDIEKVDNGLIGIKINKGINNIEFKYITPGLKTGLLLSSLSLISLIIYLIYTRKTNNKR